jgi:hypothetical protein
MVVVERPPRKLRVPKDKMKTRRIPLQVTEDQYADLKDYADRYGWTVNTAIRAVLQRAGVMRDA